MKYQPLAILSVCALLLVSYQNCDKNMSFMGSNQSASKSGEPDVLPGEVDVEDPNNLPPVADPEEEDYDHDGKRMPFRCVAGSRSDLADLENLASSVSAQDDKNLSKVHTFRMVIDKARNLSVARFHGSLLVKKALSSNLRDLHGLSFVVNSAEVNSLDESHAAIVGVRSLKLKSLTKVRAGVTLAAAREIGTIDDVRTAHLCVSGSQIDSVTNVHTAYLKIVGREDNAAKATARNVANLRGFASIKKINVASISDVRGYLIIRDSEIEEISNVRGEIVLINSKVKTLKDMQGILRTKNSTIDAKVDVNVNSFRLP